MTHTPTNPWKKLSSEVIHKNQWYTVRKDQVLRPDGTPGEYTVVVEHDFVIVVAMDAGQHIYLIGIYRYPTSTYSLELPGGNTDGEDPLESAKRELREEAGITAKSWKKLGKYQGANGILTSFGHVFLAEDLQEAQAHDQAVEGIKEVQKVPLNEVLAMIKDGRITNCQSIAAIAYLALDLGIQM